MPLDALGRTRATMPGTASVFHSPRGAGNIHNINYRIKLYERFRCNVVNLLHSVNMLVVTSTYFYTVLFLFHFACDWRVNVQGIFFMFQLAYSYFYVSPSLHGFLLQSTNLKNYPHIYTNKIHTNNFWDW